MSSMGQGYFPSDLSPEDQEAMQAIRRKQAYAQALLSSDTPQGRFGGLASAGNKLLGAFLANRTDAKEQDLAKSISDRNTKDWSTILGGGSSQPPLAEDDPRTGGLSGHMPQQAPGMEGPGFTPPAPSSPQIAPGMGGQDISPQGPAGVNPQSSMVARALATGNPALLRQLGPMILQSQMGRDQKVWENNLPRSVAEQQASDAQLHNQEELAGYTNKLPMTATAQAADQRARDTNRLGYAQLNKPQFVPYGSSGYMQGSQYHPITPGGGAGLTPGGNPDGKSPQEILGISGNGYNSLTGNYAGMAPRDKAAAQREVDGMLIQRGLDPSVVRPRVQGLQDTVKTNTIKSNTIDYLTNELKGTIQNFIPVADKIAPNDFRWGNQGAQYIGTAFNGPDAQQYAYYMTQLRGELAGTIAAAAGKIGLHGQVEADQSHYQEAEKIIKDGLSSGGVRGLAKAVEDTRAKNVRMVQHQSIEAQRGIWDAVGLAPQFDKLHQQQGTPTAPNAGGGSDVPPPPPGFVVH